DVEKARVGVCDNAHRETLGYFLVRLHQCRQPFIFLFTHTLPFNPHHLDNFYCAHTHTHTHTHTPPHTHTHAQTHTHTHTYTHAHIHTHTHTHKHTHICTRIHT